MSNPFEAAFQAVPFGVVLLDEHQGILWCNATASVHLDLDPFRDTGQKVTNLLRDPALVAALEAKGTPDDFRITTLRPGQTLLMQVRLYDQGHRLILCHDVTEADRMEVMRRDFVAHVSHEIRTPLTVLAGFVETMQSIALEGPEQDRVLDLMRQQTVRMEKLVQDLLTLANLEGSPRPAIANWLPLLPFLQSAWSDAQHLSEGRHQIEMERPERAGLEVAVEESELSSAIGNLMSNAVRYTPAGGLIRLSTIWRGDGYLEIKVNDTGIGIDRQHLPRITQRFYRVDKSRSRETGGTGLGLAIVKHAIGRHGGELLVESTPGTGSTFTLTIPPARVRDGQSASSAAPGPAVQASDAAVPDPY